jgi:hypothetical protein
VETVEGEGASVRNHKLGLWLLAGGLLPASLGAAPAVAGPLVMTCHELIQGAPYPDGNQYVLDGDVLTNHAFGTVTFLSSSKLTGLTPQGRAGTWTEHKVVGHKVYRAVYDKDRTGRTVRVVREVYDFDKQTVRNGSDHADSCHHSGR